MRSLVCFAMITLWTAGYNRADAEPSQSTDRHDMALTVAIDHLSSNNGVVRTAATRLVFDKGKSALEPLRNAGAENVAPEGTLSSRRIDIVYSLLRGLGKNPADNLSGYSTNSLGLRLEDGLTEQDVIEMGRRHGFELNDTLLPGASPTCYVTLMQGRSLATVIQTILSNEQEVISISLNYFVKCEG